MALWEVFRDNTNTVLFSSSDVINHMQYMASTVISNGNTIEEHANTVNNWEDFMTKQAKRKIKRAIFFMRISKLCAYSYFPTICSCANKYTQKALNLISSIDRNDVYDDSIWLNISMARVNLQIWQLSQENHAL